MNANFILNLIGAGLASMAVILHIVCVATPHYSTMDLAEQQKKAANSSLSTVIPTVQGSWYFGLWRFCSDTKLPTGQVYSFCFKLGDENSQNDQTHFPESVNAPDWLKAVQALLIIGLLVEAGGGVLSVTQVVVRSKGDRLRLFPITITALCVAGGVIILIGDIIFSSKHSHLYIEVTPSQEQSLIPEETKAIIYDAFSLTWGFYLDIFAAVLGLGSGLTQGAAAWLTRAEGNAVV